ncbi:BTB/POZ domain-containing protein [Tanacetum coccineum]
MPTEMELTLEQTQQGVSYEVSVFTMKMEILLEPTSNKLMVEHAEYDESNTYVLERFNTTAGNPVKKILLKLNLSDHRKLKEGGEDFRYSDTERLSRNDEVLKSKNFKKDATLKLSKSSNQEWYEHVGPEVASPQDGKVSRWRKEIVCDALKFDDGISSCLKYLEVVPWSEGEEERVTMSLNELHLPSDHDVLERVAFEASTSLRIDDIFLKLLTGVLHAKDEKARREMKSLISRLLREGNSIADYYSTYNKLELSKETLYTICHRCVTSLILCLSEVTSWDKNRGMLSAITREADNLEWVALLSTCIMIGRGNALLPKETRIVLEYKYGDDDDVLKRLEILQLSGQEASGQLDPKKVLQGT